MAPAGQWTLRRPRWAALLGAVIGLGGSLGVAYCFSSLWAAMLVLLLVWRLGRYQSLKPFAANAQLCLGEAGWELHRPGLRQPLCLAHAWPAFAWMTLRFLDLDATNPKDTMLELTIWKSSVSPDAWRQLNVAIAAQPEASGSVAAQGAV